MSTCLLQLAKLWSSELDITGLHVLRRLHWLRISDRIIFKILILTHKAFHGVAPVYLCELITKHEHATVRTRRAQDCFLLSIPPISKTCAVSFLSDHFCVLLQLYGINSVLTLECLNLISLNPESRLNFI